MQATYPAHEQEQFLAHFRGLIGMWVPTRVGRDGPLTPYVVPIRARSRAVAIAWVSVRSLGVMSRDVVSVTRP